MAEAETTGQIPPLKERDYESEAREMHWVPKGEFHGDPEKWVDAKQFVENGEKILPIVRAQAKELRAENRTLQGEVLTLKEELKAISTSLKAIEESHEADVQARLKATKREIREKLIKAREDEDRDAMLELEEQLDDLRDAEREAKTAKETRPAERAEKPELKPSPEYLEWLEQNSWFNTDKKRARRALLVAQEIQEDNPGLTGKSFFKKVDEELARLSGNGVGRRPAESKVEGGRTPGGGNESSDRGYGDLPAEARRICDDQAKRLVGEGRAYKDINSWRAFYARTYFETESIK